MYVLFKARTSPYPDIVRHEDEQYYYDPNTGTKEPFPSLNQTPRISLSVIVPAYNEEKRCNFRSIDFNVSDFGLLFLLILAFLALFAFFGFFGFFCFFFGFLFAFLALLAL